MTHEVAKAMLVGKEHAADRLMQSQKLWRGGPYLGDEEPPSRRQVAAVLHALADHTLIENMLHRAPEFGAHRAHLGGSWATTSGLGRYFQNMGDWLEYGPAAIPAHSPVRESADVDGGSHV